MMFKNKKVELCEIELVSRQQHFKVKILVVVVVPAKLISLT